jgi:hypothetical protein
MMESAWSDAWAWGLPLTAFTIVLHVAGLVFIALVASGQQRRVRRAPLRAGQKMMAMLAVMGGVGLALAVLHGLQAMIWAVAFLALGALDSWPNAILFSLDSMTTRGAAGFELAGHWRLLGALEAACGMLVFGLSTAFLAVMITHLWSWLQPHLEERRAAKDRPEQEGPG